MMLATEGAGIHSATAREIAQVAARLFAARGYDATPVQAIVEAAGVTKPTLYYHFKSKEGLAQALLTRPLTDLVETLRELVQGSGDPVTGLVDLVEAHFSFVRQDPDRVRFFYAVFFGPLGSGLSTELAGFGDQLDAVLRSALDRLAQAKIIAPDRAGALFTVVRGLIIVRTMDHLYCDSELGPGLARRWVDDLLRGFGTIGWEQGNH